MTTPMIEAPATLPPRKTVRISGKRQMTIPKAYYDELGFHETAIITIEDGAMVIRPVGMTDAYFSDLILSDLVDQGYHGEELVRQFRIMHGKVRGAVEDMIAEAEEIAANATKSANYDDLFGV